MRDLNKREDEEVISLLANLGRKVSDSIISRTSPHIDVPIRGKGNVEFDSEQNLLQLGV